MGAQAETQDRKMVLRHGGAPLVAERGLADDLSAQDSVSLRARQTKGSPHAPEDTTQTPAVDLRVEIDGLAQGLEGKGGLSVGKDEQQPEQFAVDASGRGDDRRQEGVTHTLSLVTPAIFVNLLLSTLRKREANVRLA